MATDIKCPNCGHQFEPNEAIRDEVERELRSKLTDWQKKKNEEFQLKLDDEKKRMQQSLEESVRKNIMADVETKLQMLEENNKDQEEKLKEARKKELDFLRKEQELKNREAEIEITVQKQLQKDREKLEEDIRKIEEQRTSAKETEYQMRQKELEKQLEDQKKLVDEMRRRAELGSSQLHGEVQEQALEEMLRNSFPFDLVTEVPKGVRGADCVQIVRNNFGQECGKIVYESKRTSSFIADWIEKLKMDMRSLGADIAVIVTKTMPKDMDTFGIKDGVWICSYAEARALATVLRDGIMRVFVSAKANENKGDKMHLLYDYLTSGEFAEQWKAIREGFLSMKISIQRERDAMEKLWKAREKQLEKVLLNAARVKGSIEGISGNDVEINLLPSSEEENEDDMAH